jgi:hypothetical protein
MGSLVKNLRRQLVPKREPDLVKYVKEVYDAPNLWQVVKKGGWMAVFDGSLAEQVRHVCKGDIRYPHPAVRYNTAT